jgi:two-component system chemotaxis response regulator CheB
VIIAQHVRDITHLPGILRLDTRLDVRLAKAGDVLQCGRVYVGPPNQHVLVTADGRIQLAGGRHLRHRPSADWLFESVAGGFAERAIAVVLSGRLSDGARGVVHVKRAGGHVFAQEPATCRFPDMPVAAIRSGAVDAALAPDDMASMLLRVLDSAVVARGAYSWREPFSEDGVN